MEFSLGTYAFDKETKNTVRYSKGSETQYIPKSAFPASGKYPETVEVVIKATEEA